MRSTIRVAVTEASQASQARRLAIDTATQAGFDQTLAGQVAIAVTEAGNNIARHTTGGEILVSTHISAGSRNLDVLAIDRGPGMNVNACLVDGFSTAGTQGTGLGAISRLASEFDAYSDSNGTVVFVRFSAKNLRAPLPRRNVTFGSARAPKPGETACGDDWTIVNAEGSTLILVADGLGHGAFAAEAAAEAVHTIEGGSFSSVADSVALIHGALRGTRGAAIAVAELSPGGDRVNYCGLGNIGGALLSPSSVQHLVSLNGTAGHDAPRINSFQYSWPARATLVMHSDGLVTQWSIDRYPGLLKHHPGVIAGVLYRDFSRGRDDTTVVVVKHGPEGGE
jgi:anti-sigma regulatory factor (Ser/Thr protein kinase)